MSITENPEWGKPLPRPDNVSREYWAAAAGGTLLIQQCPACGNRQFYPRALCTSCGGDRSGSRRSDGGVVHTFTVIRQYGMRPFVDELPYVVAMVELAEGPVDHGERHRLRRRRGPHRHGGRGPFHQGRR